MKRNIATASARCTVGKLIASGTPDDLKAQSANDEQPDPTMEQAFIQLIHDWDKEHSNE